MPLIDRPRRSALYVPGNNVRALGKATALPADVVILDLEDAVGAEHKSAARRRVLEAVAAGDYAGREVVIRINGHGSEYHAADLAAVAASGADGVLVPKVGCGREVRALDDALTAAGAPRSLQLWVMVETPAAFLHAEEIAAASERLAALVIGTNDLIHDLHARDVPGRAPIAPMLALALLAARAAGKSILDGVFPAIRDIEGFAAEARQGRAMGFDGKTVIHPDQIELANTVFGPSDAELAYARRAVSEFQRARAEGRSVIVLDGKMLEELHIRDAQRVLDLAAHLDHTGSVGV